MAKLASTFSFFVLLTVGVMQAEAKSGFCVSDVRELKLDPSTLGEGYAVSYLDAGTAQVSCIDCQGLRTVDVLLGVAGDEREAALKDGSLSAETMTQECRQIVGDCSVTTFVEGASVGYWEEVRHSGMVQRKYRLFNSGEVLTVRATAAVSDREWVSSSAGAIFRSALRKIHC